LGIEVLRVLYLDVFKISSRFILNFRTLCPISLLGFHNRVSAVALHYRYLPASKSSPNQLSENLLRIKGAAAEGYRGFSSSAPKPIIDEKAAWMFICRIRINN